MGRFGKPWRAHPVQLAIIRQPPLARTDDNHHPLLYVSPAAKTHRGYRNTMKLYISLSQNNETGHGPSGSAGAACKARP